jgi:hypothetical protein
MWRDCTDAGAFNRQPFDLTNRALEVTTGCAMFPPRSPHAGHRPDPQSSRRALDKVALGQLFSTP